MVIWRDPKWVLYESILVNIAAVTKDLEAVYQTDIRRS